ncbi:MAG: class I SAM-dependent methyltransferase [Aureibaculum sp.]|nr:class I SAM-dependent methyltransferase [Aureibaculum sp.]
MRDIHYIWNKLIYVVNNMSRDMHCKGEWFELVCASLKQDSLKINGEKLPGFPDDSIQISTTGQAGKETLCEAYIFYDDCIKVFGSSENITNSNRTLLDFGSGWGRILRFFIKDFPVNQVYGVDINSDFLDICKSTFNYGNFIKSEAFPPLEIGDESIDFIVGYSVFSHLSEEACLSWIKEFSRILRPGGMVALTTRGRWFFDYCESLKSKDGYSGALGYMFDDFNEARARYDRGELVHVNGSGISGNGPLNEEFYGETFIPEVYARHAYSHYLDFVEFKFSPGRQTHPIMFFRKP